MEPKLVLSKEKSVAKVTLMARLDAETHDALKSLSDQSGIPIIKLISKCVSFALKYAVVED